MAAITSATTSTQTDQIFVPYKIKVSPKKNEVSTQTTIPAISKPRFSNPFEEMEVRHLNPLDHILVIGSIAGLFRVVMAIIQFFVAIIDEIKFAATGKSLFKHKENHFKHAGLNLFRGLVSCVPIVGNFALRSYDLERQERYTYENETYMKPIMTSDGSGIIAIGSMTKNAITAANYGGVFLGAQ